MYKSEVEARQFDHENDNAPIGEYLIAKHLITEHLIVYSK